MRGGREREDGEGGGGTRKSLSLRSSRDMGNEEEEPKAEREKQQVENGFIISNLL